MKTDNWKTKNIYQNIKHTKRRITRSIWENASLGSLGPISSCRRAAKSLSARTRTPRSSPTHDGRLCIFVLNVYSSNVHHHAGFWWKRQANERRKERRRKIDFHWKTMRLRALSLHTAQHRTAQARTPSHGEEWTKNFFPAFTLFVPSSDSAAKWNGLQYISQWNCTYSRSSFSPVSDHSNTQFECTFCERLALAVRDIRQLHAIKNHCQLRNDISCRPNI